MPVTLRFDATPDTAAVASLGRQGITLGGGIGALRDGWIEPKRLREPMPARILRVESTWAPWLARPLELAGDELQSTPLSGALLSSLGVEAGEGVVIANLDTGLDLHHPGFFYADGGAFSWIDVDGDGVLVPGIDGVDRDGSGGLDPGEVLAFVDAGLYHSGSVAPFGPHNPAAIAPLDGSFDARFDWLYQDSNGDGERSYGIASGFTESDPSFGEPLYILDDLNGDGVAQPDERLLALGSSKIKGLRLGPQTFTRGINLLEAAAVMDVDSVFHGTGTAGIMVGGQPGPGRYTGLVPEAEVLLVGTGQLSLGGLGWAVEQGASLLLVEFGLWVLQFLDGSSNLELGMDALSEDGVAVVAPSGNLGGRSKHVEVSATSGATSVGFEVPGFYSDTGDPQNIRTVLMTLLWRTEQSGLVVELVSPAGVTAILPGGSSLEVKSGEGWIATGDAQTSVRGTHRLDLILTGETDEAVLPYGDWTLRLNNPKASPLVVAVNVADDVSSWNGGVTFSSYVTDVGTVSSPGTADTAITVGAYGGRFAAAGDNGPGGLRVFSGRGPRIDGELAVDLLAPDDSITIASGRTLGKVLPYGGYQVFGGTSGAAPHVAAGVALLRQLDPTLQPAAVREVLRAGALAEAWMQPSPPNGAHGYGKLRLYSAAFDSVPVTLVQPQVSLVVSTSGGLLRSLDASATAAGDGSGWRFRWDDTYDGHWDTGYELSPVREISFPGEGTWWVRVAAVSPEGAVAHAAIALEVTDLPLLPEAPDPALWSELPNPAVPEADAITEDAGGSSARVAAPPSGGSGGCTSAPPARGQPLLLLGLFVWLVARIGRRLGAAG